MHSDVNDQSHCSQSKHDSAFLGAGGGEMGKRTREFDWSGTPVGPICEWPRSLRIAVKIMLESRYAMWLGWGPSLTFFYNDAYAKMTLGSKHPWALGKSTKEVWAEIWSDVGPRAEHVITSGEATWDEGLLLFLKRQGFSEETYHTFSYSPLPSDEGGIAGMLCVVTEETDRIIGERRLRTLRELAARTMREARSAQDACQAAANTFAANPNDLPFALIYLFDDHGTARIVGRHGVGEDSPLAPPVIDAESGRLGSSTWPIQAVLESGRAEVVSDLQVVFGSITAGPWPEPPRLAVLLPVASPGQTRPAGVVIAGVSARLNFSDEYRGFLELLAGHVATAVTNARAYEEERHRAEQLAALDRAKTAFFSNVSHEFRTPLTLMLGPIEELLSRSHTDLSPAAASQLEIANRNGLRLLRLVNSLLDFSRIEAGRVRAIYQPTDLASFTSDLASNFRAACEKAGLQLIVDCTPLPEPVFVDPEMWEKIVLNLLSNAFKFTLDGEIEVSLKGLQGSAELRVRDTGTGIPEEEMSRVFERFHRIENSRGRTHEGSGIGLALVQELVRLHGGSVSAESEFGKGTTFTVTVPLGSAHLPSDQVGQPRDGSIGAEAIPYVEEALRWLPNDEVDKETLAELPRFHESFITAAAAHHGDGKQEDDRPRVLVADDNSDMRRYVSKLLGDQFQIQTVPDGEAALEAIRVHLPDLVLTDVMMPKLDGFGLLKELRSSPRTSSLPVIMLSARAGEESRVEGMEAGADDYLVKPFGAKELLARVSAHLQMANIRKQATESIRESEQRFRALLKATADTIYRMSPDWTELRYLTNDEYIAETTESDKSWFGKYILSEDRTFVQDVIQQAIQTKGVVELEHRVLRDDGSIGWMFSRAIPLLNAAGDITEWFGAASDVTARKVAEENLKNSEERLRVTLTSIGDAVITSDTKGRIEFLNGVAESLTGWTNEDALGHPLDTVFNIVNETTRETVESPAMRALREGVIVGLANHTVLIRKDGTERPIDDSAAPVRDSDGHIVGCVLVFRDVSERRDQERKTLEQAATARKLAAIVDYSDDAIVSKTLDGTIQSWNAAAERIFGYSADEALGQPITMLFPADRIHEEEGIISRIRAGERLHHFDTVRLRKGGQPINVSLTISPIKDEDGRIVAVSTIVRDITDRKLMEDELRRIAAELSDANRQKDNFLATLAHELRNPLAPLRNGLQILRLAGIADPTVDQIRSLMDRQLTHLVRLVDDLMDLSRITRGKIELRKERIELSSVINSAVEASRPLIDSMGHELQVIVPETPILLHADPTRLSQVFMNLLTNAAKYSDAGSVISLSAKPHGEDVVVSVKDTGIGIPRDMLESIFEMFNQVERSLDRAQGGLGIGLTLVKRLVQMHGGSVLAESQGSGHGSEFLVQLPTVIASSGQSEERSLNVKATISFRILIVDDNQDGANSLAMMLRMMGHETITAYDGEEGLSIAEKTKPDVILFDIGLPKLNGYEAARKIRQQPWSRNVVLIAITGWGQDEDRRRSKEAGFAFHLVKPVDAEALTNLLVGLRKTQQM